MPGWLHSKNTAVLLLLPVPAPLWLVRLSTGHVWVFLERSCCDVFLKTYSSLSKNKFLFIFEISIVTYWFLGYAGSDMVISQQYPPITDRTLIVVLDNHKARFISAHEREVDEHDALSLYSEDIAPSDDELQLLFIKTLQRTLATVKKDHFIKVVLCFPEINRPLLLKTCETHYQDFSLLVEKKIVRLVPKNLASMPLPQILRILLEDRRH